MPHGREQVLKPGYQNAVLLVIALSEGIVMNVQRGLVSLLRVASLRLAVAAIVLAVSGTSAKAVDYYWDSNGATAGFGNAAGTWGTSAFWSTNNAGTSATANTTITSADNINFGTATLNYATSNVGVAAGGVTVGGVVMGAGQTTAINLGTSGNAITIHGGITTNAGSGALTINSPVILGANQTWTNGSTSILVTGSGTNLIDNGGFQLTVDGTGNMRFGVVNQTFNSLTGTGALIKNGTGTLEIGGDNSQVGEFSGAVSVNGGILYYGDLPGSMGTGNLLITNGVVESRWTTGFTRTQGTGAGQIQITGGVSGLSAGGNTATFNVGAITWGNATFNPTEFVLQSTNASAAGSGNFTSSIDLNGATRTIRSDQTTGGTGTFSGVISNSSGTAGLIKTGVGHHVLSVTNTYNGATTINQGTLTASVLANGGANSSIGNSSAAASNLVLGNGTTFGYNGSGHSSNRSFTINGTAAGAGASLSATGAGAVNLTNTASPAYGTVDQTRTLTLTGTSTASNTLAANIADNGAGAVSVTKTGAGLWVLSGASSYTGPTTITAGTLSVSTAGNLGAAAANLVLNGGTLQITGAGLTSFASLGRTNPVVFTSGQPVNLDINNAANVFTVDQTLNQGVGGLVKSGAGVVAINSAHTYTGQTTVSAGTLRLDDGGSISAAPLNLAGGTFAVNRTGTATLGTTIPSLIGGNSSLSNVGSGNLVLNGPTYHTGTTTATAGTITLSNSLAIQNSALGTTGAGAVVLSGVTAPTFGGLSGATGNLATVISSGYGSVTNLTLNPQSGSTFTYGGVIADGAGNMTLTKTGAGTQVLQGNNTYGGATTISAGTLTLSGASGAIASTTINLHGGGLTLDNATNSGTRVSDAATVSVNGNSALTFSHAGVAATNYAETIDTLSLQSGFLTYTGSRAAAAQTSSLNFNTLNRSGTATANFAGTSLGADTRNTIKFAAGVTNGVDLGPWAVVNGADFASYNGTNGIVAAASTTLSASSNSSTTNFNTTAGSVTITAALNPSYKTLLVTGGTARTTAINGNTVSVGGISSTGATHVISGAGAVQALTAGDGLYVNVGANTLQVDSVIQNVGAGVTASTLVKSGAGTLTLNGTNTYTGGTVINGGTIAVTANTHLGASGTSIVFDGNGSLVSNVSTTLIDLGARPIVLNNGATATFSGIATRGNFTVGGPVTGSGGVTASGGGNWNRLRLDSTANTFTGAITSATPNDDGNGANSLFSINSIADGLGYGAIILNGGGGSVPNQGIDYGSGGTNGTGGGGAIAPLVLNHRQIIVANNSGVMFNNSSAQNATINTDLGFSGTGARSIRLGYSPRSGSGISTFNGRMTDNVGGALTVTAGGGTWLLTNGNNTYTGSTTVSAGTLGFASGALGSTGAINTSGATMTWLAGNTQDISGRLAMTAATTSTFNTYGNSVVFASGIGSSTTANLAKAGLGSLTLQGTNTFSGTTTSSGGGTLVLDYGTNNTTKLSDTAALTLNAGTLTLSGGSHTEVVSATTLGSGGISIVRSGGNSTLRMNAMTRGAGGSVSFSAANIADTDTTNSNSILGGWATIGNDWAINSTNGADGAITAFSSYNGTLPSGTAGNAANNYTLTGNQTQTTGVAANTVKITTTGSSEVLNLGANNLTITSASATALGGIMYAGGGNNDYTIAGTGRIVTSTAGQELILAVNAGTLTISAPVLASASAGRVTKSGDGTLILSSANNNFTGAIRVNGGALRLANSNAAGNVAGGIFVLQDSSALELANGVNVGAEPLNILGTGISNGGALRNLASATSSYNGSVTVGAGGAFAGTARIHSDAGGSLTLNGGVVTAFGSDVVFGGAGNTTIATAGISGAGSVSMDGAGVLNLTVANTYSGSTSVVDGLLRVNNTTGSGTGTGAVTIGALGALGGNGTISGAVTVDGSIAPGNSIGILTVANDLTWNGSSSSPWVFELGAGDTADLLDITGASSDFLKGTGTGGTDFVFDFAGSADQGTFDLVSWDGTTNFSASDFDYTNLGGGNSGSFQISGSTLQFIVVPEPAAIALAVCGLAGLGVAARRRFSRTA